MCVGSQEFLKDKYIPFLENVFCLGQEFLKGERIKFYKYAPSKPGILLINRVYGFKSCKSGKNFLLIYTIKTP